MNCLQCKLEFHDLQEQRLHFKTDFHQYNLQRKLKGLEGISFEDYSILSVSGSSESDYDSDDSSQESKASEVLVLRNKPFKIIKYISGFYKTFKILDLDERSLEMLLTKDFKWVIIMVTSGHFAGGVFDHKGNLLVSKTFHRYTTRKKQGGAQSGKDNTGKMAKSAGSTLRRYNEGALKAEVQELLKSWKSLISEAQFIFIRAKNTNRAILNFDSKVLDLKDDRIKSIPFTTGRPTIDELKRCFKELLPKVIIESEVEELLDQVEEAKIEELSIQETNAQEKKEVLMVEKEIIEKSPESPTVLHFNRVVDLVKRGKLSLVSNQLNGNLHLYEMVDQEGNTLLHLAASSDQHEIVKFLLESDFDATKLNRRKQTPYQVAASKSVRDTFRRFIAYNTPSWNISDSMIPEPLTKEMEEKQKAKAKQKRSKKKSANPPLEVGEVADKVEDVPKKARGALPRLGISMMDTVGMSPEARIKLDREKRALAAERRITIKTCTKCGRDCSFDFFEKNNQWFCSTECINSRSEKS